MLYELLPDAKNDLKKIWNYTFNNWGEKQAYNYIQDIYACFEEIAYGDIFYKEIFPYDKSIKLVRCKHHYIFFLLEDKPIILRILHEKMDFASALKDRLPT